jgi:threonine/homoserine efflux transporter RhtA
VVDHAVDLGGLAGVAAAAAELALVGLALVTQILGQGLIAYAFAHLPTSLSSVSLLIQPVMATIFAWALFGEAIGAAQFVGGAVVLAGIGSPGSGKLSRRTGKAEDRAPRVSFAATSRASAR